MKSISTSLDKTLISELTAFRKKLHANPEVSGNEYKTAKMVAEFLKTCKPDELIEQVGETGIIAVYDSGKPGKSLMFRADLDALPIQEINTFDYCSTVKGVSHKCGHDGHTTTLLGFAKLLSKQRPNSGKIYLLFQPAEEIGAGAKAILTDVKFKSIKLDYIFAYHNLPSYPLNEIVVKNESFTASVKSIIIKIYGKTAHAAEPEFGLNPALAIAEILKETDLLSNNDTDRDDFKLITPVHIEMGEIAYGISAGYAEIRLTIRTWEEKYMNELATDVLNIVQKNSKKYQIRMETEWTQEFSANKNNEVAVHAIREAANKLSLPIIERKFPFKWGEDFGLFTQNFKGAMFGIGAGIKSPALHNPDYDFPDAILPVGIKLFSQISSQFLK